MKITLGESQRDILGKIALSNDSLVANQIANEREVSPAAISKSLSTLIDNKIVTTNEDSSRKLLMLTDKGMCYTFLYCGVGFSTIVSNHPYLKLPLEAIMLERIIPKGQYHDTDLDRRENWKRAVYRNIFEILVNHEEFDRSGTFLYNDHTVAVNDGEGNNLGSAGYSMRILRVVNYVINELTPHHGDWSDADAVKYYMVQARQYFNRYLDFQERRRKMMLL